MSQPIQLYSLATPNGQKVGIALEEMGLPYETHTIDIRKGEQHQSEFLALNPNGKIPAIVDPEGPDGETLTLFESGAILEYLASKTNQFLPGAGVARYETLQWLYFQMAQVGPMFGQFGHFFALAGKDNCDHPYPVERYQGMVTHTLQVLEGRLAQVEYVGGDEYTIADMATLPWVLGLERFYRASETLELTQYKAVQRWVDQCTARPAVVRGLAVCAFPG